jgi:hypothetical protein
MQRRRPTIFRASEDQASIECARLISRDAIEILKQNPTPDTFLGRKTQEPFPEGKEGAE